MIDRFFDCLPFILAREGGKSDTPGDRGGRTAYGITQATFDIYTHYSGRDVWTITQDEVAAIYRTRYWNLARCDKAPKGLDLCMFDASVQHGPVTAIRFLQQALGISVDGVFGPDTLSTLLVAVGAGNGPALIARYIAMRQEFYKAIVAHDPTQAKFANGWANRIAALKTEIGATT